ncbi:hypothetical protein [Oscillatoria salina]|uniref:hypothetical protein n=1 Tax=Oscillatoria salina TaxID=331517 RepID=UPI0013B6B98A|nr:hypothetical protein [Oscillatoria salina]MBZ8178952.1 hypothetical protein [Oscillatoria salina IIICB1]NET89409.1 hypothetical protein [Kamptonema sp. SIO1D9]
MFEPELTEKTFLAVSFAELFLIAVIGWSFGTIIRCLNNFLGSNQIYQPEDYTPRSQGYPERYRFVIVKYRANGDLESETFYTLLGDRIQIKYRDDSRVSEEGILFSNLLLAIFPLVGLGLIIFANLQDSTINFSTITPLAEPQLLRNYGTTLFFPTMLAGLIKLIFDFSYTKLL